MSHPPTLLRTASGRAVDLAAPDPATIDLGDIAHALAHQCRFAGHTQRFSSLAEHALLVSDLTRAEGAREELQLAGLLHDAHRAYLGELPAPVVALAGDELAQLTSRMRTAVATAVGLDVGLLDDVVVRDANDRALRLETAHLLANDSSVPLPQPPPKVHWAGAMEPGKARKAWEARALLLRDHLTHPSAAAKALARAAG